VLDRRMDIDRTGPFWDAVTGRVPPPPAAKTLGWALQHVDPAEGTVRVVHRGGTIAFLEGHLCDPDGNLVATATATARIVRTG